MSCNHEFHIHCINIWLGLNNSCPNCRDDFDNNYDYIDETLSNRQIRLKANVLVDDVYTCPLNEINPQPVKKRRFT